MSSVIETVQDLYPSRVSDEPQMLARLDPVIHSNPKARRQGPLDAGQLAKYEREGFLVLPGFFAAGEVDRCLTELDALRGSSDVKQRPEAIVEPAGNDLRSLFAVHGISQFFGDVAADERLVGIARQLLGSDVYVHQSRINLKPGFTGKEFYWHSDFETWHVEDGMPQMRAVSFSLLLTPNYEFNGPLMLVPGSHKTYATCVGRTPENHFQVSLRRQEYGVPSSESLTQLVDAGGIKTCTGPAGTLVIFECNTMHGSASNISPYPRSNLFLVYNSIENRLRSPFCGLEPRPEYIAARARCTAISPRRTEI